MSISDIARSVPFPFRVELIKASRRGGRGGGGRVPSPEESDTGLDQILRQEDEIRVVRPKSVQLLFLEGQEPTRQR